MRFDLQFPKCVHTRMEEWLTVIGFALFIFTFWMPLGMELVSQQYVFGVFQAANNVIFPVSGIGILLVLVGQLRRHTFDTKDSHWLFVFTFLMAVAISIFFSVSPEVSIWFLVLWTVSLLATGFREVFFIRGYLKRTLLFLSILAGMITVFWGETFEVNTDVLAMGALLGAVYAQLEEKFRGKEFLILFYVWVVFECGNLGLLFTFMLVWMGMVFWIEGAGKKAYESLLFYLPLGFLLLLMVWGRFEGEMSLPEMIPVLSMQQHWLWGVGEGQYLVSLPNISLDVLDAWLWQMPDWGVFHTYTEKGLMGILMIGMLILMPLVFNRRCHLVFSFLFFCFWLVSSELVGAENGIFFLGAFLLNPKRGLEGSEKKI